MEDVNSSSTLAETAFPLRKILWQSWVPKSNSTTYLQTRQALARGLERLLLSASQQRQRHVWRLQQLHDASEKAKAAHARLQFRQIADQERQAKDAIALQAKAAARAAREARIQVRVQVPCQAQTLRRTMAITLDS